MIRELSLRNWRSHENSRFEFGKGTNVLVGPMGSGKSSILDALCFALFGNFPALQHRRVTIRDTILNRPRQKDDAEVRAVFDWEGCEYAVTRRVSLNGASEAEIRKDGKLVQGTQPEKVNEEVKRILKIDYDLFTRAVYSEQNGIDHFLMLGRGERKKQIDELIGISQFENARSNLSNILNRIKEMKRFANSVIESFDIARVREQVKAGEAEAERLGAEIRALEESAKSMGEGKERLKNELGELERIERLHKGFKERKAGLEHTLESKRRDIADAKKEIEAGETELEIDGKAVASVEGEVDALRKEHIQAEREIARLASRRSSLVERIEARKETERDYEKLREQFKTAEELKEAIEKEDGELGAGKERLAGLKARVSELEELVASLGKELTKCPVCEATLSEERKVSLREKRKAEMDGCIGEAEKLGELVRKKELALKGLNDAYGKFSRLGEELKKHGEDGKELEKLDSEEARYRDESKEKEAKLKALEADAKRLGRLFEIKKGAESVRVLEGELASVNSKLGELRFDEKELEGRRHEEKTLEIEESRLAERCRGLKKDLEKTDELLKSRGDDIRKYEKWKYDSESYESLNQGLSLFQNSIVEAQKTLREERIQEINDAMGNFWGIIYPYGDYSDIRMKAEENDYELQLKFREAWVPVDGVASGGERSCASIALRIAFAVVLAPNLSWLILDEPTHNLDVEGIRALAWVLQEEVPKIVDQVFVITHDENLRDAASSRVYKLERNKTTGESTKIEAF